MIFKEIDIESKRKLDPYFDKVEYEACDYCFTTLFMWQHLYKTCYYIGDDFAVLLGEYEGDSFSILPLAPKERLPEVVDFVLGCFKYLDKKIYLRGITDEVLGFLKEKYKDRFTYIEERDLFDYVYDADSLRTLKGRKNQKKRNHINYFLKEYDGRYVVRSLEKTDFNDCIELLKKWENNKEKDDEFDDSRNEEFIGIKKVFDNYDTFKGKVKFIGVFVDGNLEAFTFGEYLNHNMALIHVEKANPEIRGLYPFINQQFLMKEFKEAEFVNREEDMGIEGLRRAKMSYHPIRFVEKYTVKEA